MIVLKMSYFQINCLKLYFTLPYRTIILRRLLLYIMLQQSFQRNYQDVMKLCRVMGRQFLGKR
jgi:hypothetical protein